MVEVPDGAITKGKARDSLKDGRVENGRPDGIHPAIVKPLAEVLVKLFASLFNAILDGRRPPADLLTSTVITVRKRDDRDNYSSCRPVSLTSFTLNTLERVLCDRTPDHLKAIQLLMVEQHGFWHISFCPTNFISHLEEVTG